MLLIAIIMDPLQSQSSQTPPAAPVQNAEAMSSETMQSVSEILMPKNSGMGHKIRYIVFFVICLILLAVATVYFKTKEPSTTQNPMTAEQKLLDAMTAKGPANLSTEEKKKLYDATTAQNESTLSFDERQKLLDAMKAN